jgi:hypothetical protein
MSCTSACVPTRANTGYVFTVDPKLFVANKLPSTFHCWSHVALCGPRIASLNRIACLSPGLLCSQAISSRSKTVSLYGQCRLLNLVVEHGLLQFKCTTCPGELGWKRNESSTKSWNATATTLSYPTIGYRPSACKSCSPLSFPGGTQEVAPPRSIRGFKHYHGLSATIRFISSGTCSTRGS